MSSRARHRCARRLSAAHYFRERTIEQFYTKRRQVGIGDRQSDPRLGIFRARGECVWQLSL